MKNPEKNRKHRYVSDYIDNVDICNASSACDCTGLIPSLPESEEELEAYKKMYDFVPPYVKEKE